MRVFPEEENPFASVIELGNKNAATLLTPRLPEPQILFLTDIPHMAGAFRTMFHPVGAPRNENHQMADCEGGQIARLTASERRNASLGLH
jgi:hypothetical protein